MEPGEVLKEMMRKTKTTQADLAQKIGLRSQGGISSLVSRNNFNVTTLISIANALGYEVVVKSEAQTLVLGEKLLPEEAEPKDDLETQIEKISEMLRELLKANQIEKARPSGGKIPLAKDPQYRDPEWYIQLEDKKRKK